MKRHPRTLILFTSLFVSTFLISAPYANAAEEEQTWLPEGSWDLEWQDEFSGTGEPENWYPMLGYNSEEYKAASEKGLRWTGSTAESARMYSTKSGNHWLNGEGQLVIRAITDKTAPENEHGLRVKTGYLLSGYPDHWDKSEPSGVKWKGLFVSPRGGDVYISARIRSDQVVGYSTWFAFWLFSETRGYNDNPSDGTEVDIVEIVKGKDHHFNTFINVANHWKKSGGTEDKYFNEHTTPLAAEYVDVTDSDYHTYGIEWTKTSMTCFVDGKPYYTFTENIPSDPVDMMILLTMEFSPNSWIQNQGDGRSEGPYVSDDPEMREMSRALIDYVRIYRKQP
ncbi:family 16 glycosylhydrolase [Kiritimatiellota bacterium B12222]|nr:family 16 glycosylhydrolase [Kiritimatiellota bacterium B12222]